MHELQGHSLCWYKFTSFPVNIYWDHRVINSMIETFSQNFPQMDHDGFLCFEPPFNTSRAFLKAYWSTRTSNKSLDLLAVYVFAGKIWLPLRWPHKKWRSVGEPRQFGFTECTDFPMAAEINVISRQLPDVLIAFVWWHSPEPGLWAVLSCPVWPQNGSFVRAVQCFRMNRFCETEVFNCHWSFVALPRRREHPETLGQLNPKWENPDKINLGRKIAPCIWKGQGTLAFAAHTESLAAASWLLIPRQLIISV